MAGQLLTRRDGWYEWRDDGLDAMKVRVQFRTDEDGRHHVDEVALSGTVTNDGLRSISVSRIEATADAQLGSWTHLPDEVVALSRRALTDLVEPAGHRDWDISTSTRVVARGAGIREAAEVPAGRGLPDDHYQAVAARYLALSAQSHRPAADLAQEYGKPVTTAHRWIREARRRNYLPPGRPGRAG